MITYSKLRFYRFMLAAIVCFLCSTILFDLFELHVAPFLLDSISGLLEFVGCILGFFAFEALSYRDDYDRTDEIFSPKSYIPLFFILTALMLIATLILVVRAILHAGSMGLAEQLVIVWGLVIALLSAFLGRQSRREIG